MKFIILFSGNNNCKYTVKYTKRLHCDKSNIHKPRALNLKDCRKSTQRLKVSLQISMFTKL